MTTRSPMLPPTTLEAGSSTDLMGLTPRCILLIVGDALDEAVLASSLVEPLQRHWPEASLWILTADEAVDWFRAAPGLAGVLAFQRDMPGTSWAPVGPVIQAIQREVRPDLTLVAPVSRDLLVDTFALASQAPVRLGHHGDLRHASQEERDQASAFYTHLLLPSKEGTELDDHGAMLDVLGVPHGEPMPQAWITQAHRDAAQWALAARDVQAGGFLAVGVGAEETWRRHPRLGSAIRRVLEVQPDLRVVLLGGRREEDLAAQLCRELPTSVVNLCGRLTAPERAAAVAQARLLLAAESGLVHLAAAVGTPQVVVLGGGCFGRFLPYAPGTHCVVHPLVCFGCGGRCTEDRPHCVEDLDPAVIAEAVLHTLDADEVPTLPSLLAQRLPEDAVGPDPLDLAPLLDPTRVVLATREGVPPEVGVDFTLVVTSMARPELLDAMLRTIPAALAGASWELIGIHPRHDTATGEVFRRHGAVHILHDEDFPAPAGGFSWSTLMNAGFARARGRWVMYGSDDLSFESEAIARAMAFGDVVGPEVGGIALAEHNSHRQNCPEWFVPFGYGRQPMINFGVVRREVFRKVGGFHVGFHFYAADFDLCLRILAAGWKILPLWDGRVRHHQVLADDSHAAHEGRHDADRDLLLARADLHPPSRWPDGRFEYSDLDLQQSRDLGLQAAETCVEGRSLEPLEAWLGRWQRRLPGFGFLSLVAGKVHEARGISAEAALAQAARLGWRGPLRSSAAEDPSQAARTTVFCAVWHKDPERFERLKGHQACLDAQLIPVERVYVFDGGDSPPTWLKGRVVTVPEPLSIYEAWAQGLAVVATPYVLNLNLDDRLNPDAVAVFEKVLDGGADLVGGDWRICFSQAETDAVGRSEPAVEIPFAPAWPPLPGRTVRLGSGTGERGTLGPACAWRMSLHAEIGPYPSRFGDGSPIRVIGDSLWWRRLLEGGREVRRVPVVLGRYHSHPSDQAEFRNPAEAEEARLRVHGIQSAAV